MNTPPNPDKVDSIFTKFAEPGSPGCALAIMKDGQIIYRKGYGLANIEHNVPVIPSTVFNIGSESKQFTAFAILLLADAGKLDLDDDMRTHLPEMHDFGETVTLRHLIHHTSGIRDTFPPLVELAGYLHEDVITHETQWALLKAQRDLNFKPGDEHSYSNANYALLAQIVQRVSGQPFARFCQERIFDPLGMTSTCIQDFHLTLIKNRAASYYYDEETGRTMNAPVTSSEIGSTSVYTTVEDLALWDENYYTGKVGGKALIEQMLQTMPLNDGSQNTYAFGLFLDNYRGLKTVEHGGNHGGYCAYLMRFPEQHFSVVTLSNLFTWSLKPLNLQVADLYLQDAFVQEPVAEDKIADGPVTIQLTNAQLQSKVGQYFDAGRVRLRSVEMKEGKLHYVIWDLLPISENEFVLDGETQVKARFVPATGDTPDQLWIINNDATFKYNRVEPVQPTPEELQQYVGLYFSPELNQYWTIVLDGDTLMVRRRRPDNHPLTPVFADAFTDDWSGFMGYPDKYFILFDRDSNDAITGFGVSSEHGSLRHLKFIRQDQ